MEQPEVIEIDGDFEKARVEAERIYILRFAAWTAKAKVEMDAMRLLSRGQSQQNYAEAAHDRILDALFGESPDSRALDYDWESWERAHWPSDGLIDDWAQIYADYTGSIFTAIADLLRRRNVSSLEWPARFEAIVKSVADQNDSKFADLWAMLAPFHDGPWVSAIDTKFHEKMAPIRDFVELGRWFEPRADQAQQQAQALADTSVAASRASFIEAHNRTKQWSIYQLAVAMGVDTRVIKHYQEGRPTQTKTRQKLADAYGVPLDQVPL